MNYFLGSSSCLYVSVCWAVVFPLAFLFVTTVLCQHETIPLFCSLHLYHMCSLPCWMSREGSADLHRTTCTQDISFSFFFFTLLARVIFFCRCFSSTNTLISDRVQRPRSKFTHFLFSPTVSYHENFFKTHNVWGSVLLFKVVSQAQNQTDSPVTWCGEVWRGVV